MALAHGYLRQAFSNIGGLLLFWRLKGMRPMPALTLSEGPGRACPTHCRSSWAWWWRYGDSDPKRDRWHSERGAELIEMAIVLPLLLLVVIGIVDFGFMFQRYVVLTNAAMEGARVGVLPGYAPATPQSRAESPMPNGGVPVS